MKTSRQLLALIAPIAVIQGLIASPVLAQGPAGGGSKPAPPTAAPATTDSLRHPTIAARQSASGRPVVKRQGQSQVRQDDERPVATFPGFRMLGDGSSRVFLQVHGKVEVKESKTDGRLVYRMKGVQAIQTNRFPLVTSFFATPVSKVQLVGQGNDLDLVIDLRDRSEAKFTVVESERGIVVQVDFPPAAIQKSAPEDAKPNTEPTARNGKRVVTPERSETDSDSTDF